MLLITEDSACVSRGASGRGGVCQSYHDLEREIQKRVSVVRIDRHRGIDIELKKRALAKGPHGQMLRLAFKIRYWSALIRTWLATYSLKI